MNPVLKEILRTCEVTSDKGERFPLHGAISRDEGEFLQSIIFERKPRISLEIGLAYGISALFICEALEKVGATKHIVIDPYQNESTSWRGIGLKNLRQAGYEELVEFIEEPSEIALPDLLKSGTRVDFAFVDGWHTFDHALVDFFYINMMLNIGGMVSFDDANWASISKLCRFISRYPCYKIFRCLPTIKGTIKRAPIIAKGVLYNLITFNSKYVKKDLIMAIARCIAFIKEKENKRNYDWHKDF